MQQQDAIERVNAELEHLGYTTAVFQSPRGSVISFDYTIETGSHKGEQVKVGLSFQETNYPEYPPHWVHITPVIDDGRGGSTVTYTDDQGRAWFAMSRPPGNLWDQLPTKHIGGYITHHLRRIWTTV